MEKDLASQVKQSQTLYDTLKQESTHQLQQLAKDKSTLQEKVNRYETQKKEEESETMKTYQEEKEKLMGEVEKWKREAAMKEKLLEEEKELRNKEKGEGTTNIRYYHQSVYTWFPYRLAVILISIPVLFLILSMIYLQLYQRRNVQQQLDELTTQHKQTTQQLQQANALSTQIPELQNQLADITNQRNAWELEFNNMSQRRGSEESNYMKQIKQLEDDTQAMRNELDKLNKNYERVQQVREKSSIYLSTVILCWLLTLVMLYI